MMDCRNNIYKENFMKNIIFSVLSIFIISSVGYSEIRNLNGIILDDRIFGETEICQAIGGYYYLNTLGFTEMEMYGQNSEELFNDVAEGLVVTDTALRNIGWNKSSVEMENINSYYIAKCNKIKMGDIKNTNNDYYSNKVRINFYNLMNNLGMLIN